jgi:pseudouridine-5'-phosphate glycosidase
MSQSLQLFDEVRAALDERRPVVALESTVIAHGLPWPVNLETARAVEAIVRVQGAIPATIAVWEGVPTVGLSDEQLQALAQRKDVIKASRRDLGIAVASKHTAATTVAATMFLAHQAGIRVFATGGIGGAHRDSGQPWDISADLFELARLPVAVICAGAKSILDIPRTLEILETYSVPVIGFGTETFPAFYLPSSGEPVTTRVDTPEQAAAMLTAHWYLGGAGAVIAQPVASEIALDDGEFQQALARVEAAAKQDGIRGKELTPFLLKNLATATGNRSLQANQALLIANAHLAARIACSM